MKMKKIFFLLIAFLAIIVSKTTAIENNFECESEDEIYDEVLKLCTFCNSSCQAGRKTTTRASTTTTQRQTTTTTENSSSSSSSEESSSSSSSSEECSSSESSGECALNPCADIFFGILPNPSNCSTFYVCIENNATLWTCPQDYIFNANLVSCMPGDPETCEFNESTTAAPQNSTTTQSTLSTTDPTTTSSTLETETTTTPFNYCANQASGFIPFPSSCVKFITCENYQVYLIQNCPIGMIFNVDSCVPGNSDTCESFITTTTPTTTKLPDIIPTSTSTAFTSTTRRDDVIINFSCPRSGYGFIPHSIYCYKYYECINGIQYLRECENNLYFDAITSTCVEPSLALCGNLISCVV
jgi:hypothetical protein